MINSLISYKVANSPTLPPATASLKEYWIAGNGIFMRAKRLGLSACVPVTNCILPGLPEIAPCVQMEHPLVPTHLVVRMLHIAKTVGEREILFYLSFVGGSWQLNIPEQVATPGSVTSLTSSGCYETALIEVHSHHWMKAQFSSVDDEEESGKFRIFAVLGQIFTRPQINVRLGIYSNFWQIPANSIFELPVQLTDSYPCN